MSIAAAAARMRDLFLHELELIDVDSGAVGELSRSVTHMGELHKLTIVLDGTAQLEDSIDVVSSLCTGLREHCQLEALSLSGIDVDADAAAELAHTLPRHRGGSTACMLNWLRRRRSESALATTDGHQCQTLMLTMYLSWPRTFLR